MDAKYLGVTLSNDLEWSKHIATMTNKANSKLSFLHCNLKGCPEKLKQTVYFSLIRSFMEYGTTVWDPYQKYNSDKVERVQHSVELQGSSKVGIQDTLVFLICLMCWDGRLFLKEDRRLDLFFFTKLLTVWHKCPLKVSLSRHIRVLDNLDRLAIQLASMDSRFFLKLLVHGTGLLSLTGQVGLVVGSWPCNRATEGSNPKRTRLYFVILFKNVEKMFDWH